MMNRKKNSAAPFDDENAVAGGTPEGSSGAAASAGTAAAGAAGKAEAPKATGASDATEPQEPEILEPVDFTPEEAEEAGIEDAAEADLEEATSQEEADAIIAEAEAALEDVESESEAIGKAKAEATEWKDKFMRLHAEWDTYRRRTNEQREAEKVRAAENLVSGLIPVLDDFERTISYANENGEAGLLGGVKAVYAKLVDVLQKDGVQIIDPEGEAFDALEAQAVGTVEDTDAFDETVAQVYQKGYRLGTKVLRPAMVTVTTGGPKRPKPEE